MKIKWFAASVIVAGLAAMTPSKAMAYYCVARSATGSWGWGQAGSLSRAKSIALYQCAVRTSRRYYCYITYCE